MNRFFIAAILLMLSLSRHAYAQSAAILKDSAAIGPEYYVLEELRLDPKYEGAKQIYKRIRSGSGIMESAISLPPEQRLRIKKDTLLALTAEGTLREAGYGFEHYRIHFDRYGLLNLSVDIQSHGSPFESSRSWCFDISSGKETGRGLFIRHKKLLKAITKKLQGQYATLKAELNDLDSFEIIPSGTLIEGVRFLVVDRHNYKSSGYETAEAYFSLKEIYAYLAPKYREVLAGK